MQNGSARKGGLASVRSFDINQAFEDTQTSVAASQMRNALNNLSDTVKDPAEKKVCLRISTHDDRSEELTGRHVAI